MRGTFTRDDYDPEVFDCGDWDRLRQARRYRSQRGATTAKSRRNRRR